MFGNIFKDKKVLITGNTGFKGSWLSIWLLKLGAQVYGISKNLPSSPSMFEELGIGEKIVYFKEDIRRLGRMLEIIKEVKPDFLFHLAAQPIVSLSYKEPIETISSNVMGTANILEALRINNQRCAAVIITSDKCYDNVEWIWGYRENDKLGGKDIYSGSKGAAELIFKSYFHSFLKNSPIKAVSARAGNVIGGGDWAMDRIVPDCMRSWSINKAVEIRMPNATRPWQHVLEPLSGYLTLAMVIMMEHNEINGESFNFGPNTEQNYTVRELIEDMSRLWGFDDSRKACSIIEDVDFSEAGLLKLNCDKALVHLKWLPVLGYKKMIEFTTLWYYEFYKKSSDMFEYTLKQIEEYESIAASKRLIWTK
ncbi:MAG: CDP-glucose 4,6-dehydratase [Thermodesulfovibrionales bacterium]|nr:CDP-glucose 4,6-dehydratase [Thermodesulfovibrionales bacterium]